MSEQYFKVKGKMMELTLSKCVTLELEKIAEGEKEMETGFGAIAKIQHLICSCSKV